MTEEEATAAEGQEVEEQVEQQEEQQEQPRGETQEESSEAGRVAQAIRQDYQGKLDEEKRARQMIELELMQLRQQSQTQQQPVDEDDDDVITKGEFKKELQANAMTWQRQVAENAWIAGNQDSVKEIETYLPDILKKKPWLADVIQKAPNRYQVAIDMVNAYRPKEKSTAKKIVENASKPGNPSAVGKSAKLSNLDKLKAMSPKEFREYRRKLLNRR